MSGDFDVLDQGEVDALLSAIDSGDYALDEVVAEDKMEKDVAVYDFTRPERVSKEQLQALETMHEGFSRNLASSLSAFMRTIVGVKLNAADQMTFSDFIHTIASITDLNLLTMDPLDGEIILEVNLQIVFAIINKLLGGGTVEAEKAAKKGPSYPNRALTDIEQDIISNIIKRVIENLNLTWRAVKDITFKVTQTESNPQMMQIVAPNEPVVVISFDIIIAEEKGSMNLCLPYMAIEPMMEEIAAQGRFGYMRGKKDEHVRRSISHSLKGTNVDVLAYLAETTITMSDLLNLKVGDMILTPMPANSDMFVAVGKENKFRAKPGIFRDHKSARILGPSK